MDWVDQNHRAGLIGSAVELRGMMGCDTRGKVLLTHFALRLPSLHEIVLALVPYPL